jgi:hypothetical protein
MREHASGDRRNGFLFGGLAVLGVAALSWTVWAFALGGGGTTGDLKPAALCSACGYFAEGPQLKLEGSGARAPVYGPGYKCPKCGKETLYVNPFICQKCKTPFLLVQSGAGKAVAKCPRCGWTG